jgi:putative lipoprotein
MKRLLAVSGLVLLALPGCMITDRQGTTELPGTSWQLVDLDGAEPVEGAVPTMVFGDDGTVSGNASCNTYSGEVSIDGSELTFGPLPTTRMACVDAAVAEQETAFLLALESVASYTIDSEGRLVLEGDAPLTFEVAPEES